jgi:lysophospholipase L1-like esterase
VNETPFAEAIANADPAVRETFRRAGDAATRAAGRVRRTQFDAVPLLPDATVYVGDSITEYGLWNEWFPDSPARNRGVAAETIADILDRLDSALSGGPVAVSLLAGTNDVDGPRSSGTADEIACRAEHLVRKIRLNAPDARLVVTGVLPRTSAHVDTIHVVNARYRAVCREVGASYVDLWDELAKDDGAIRPEYSRDGLHLTGAGYRVWVAALSHELVR